MKVEDSAMSHLRAASRQHGVVVNVDMPRADLEDARGGCGEEARAINAVASNMGR
jgi:hypothetical protein